MNIIHLSIRKDFADAYRFGGPEIVIGTTHWTGDAALLELGRRTAGKRVVVLIHGYSNALSGASEAYDGIAKRLGDLYDVAIFFYWPGSLPKIGFHAAWRRADDAGALLRSILEVLAPRYIDVQTHSLGARVWGWCAFPFRLSVLAGAAIPDTSVMITNGEYTKATAASERVLVVHSERDSVLAGAYRTAWLWTRRALGHRGPRGQSHPRVRVLDASADVAGHGGYKDSELMFARWRELASTNQKEN